MSRVIWKYQFPLGEADRNGRYFLTMPVVAHFLDLQVQHGTPTAWFQVEPQSAHVSRTFEWVGTGSCVGHFDGEYLGTVQVDGGDSVFHLYEVVGS